MSMETMVDRQINANKVIKKATEFIVKDSETHAEYLGQVMQACAVASLDTDPESDLLDNIKEAASKAEELRIQACADLCFFQRYKEQHQDQQEDDTEGEKE